MKKFTTGRILRMFCGCVLTAGMIVNVTACSKKDDTSPSGTGKEDNALTTGAAGETETFMDMDEYLVDMMTLDYTKYLDISGLDSLKLTTEDVTPSDDLIAYNVGQAMAQVFKTEEVDREIQAGDTVIIDYVGYINDVAFEGGTDTGASLGIGSQSFIDGFESGLIGKKAGDEVELQLKFPEDYRSEDYAGKDVVFKVTVQKVTTLEEITDEMVAKEFPDTYKTYDEYYEALKAEYMESYRSDEIWLRYCDAVKVTTVNEELVEEYIAMNLFMIDYYAMMYQVDRAAYLQGVYGMTEDQFRKYMQSYGEQYAKQKLMILALTDKYNLTPTDEERQEFIDEMIKNNDFKDEAALREEYTDSEIEFEIIYQKVFEYLDNLEI